MAKELINYPLFSDANLLNYYRFEGNANDSKGSLNGTATNITFSYGNGKFGQGMQSAAASGDGINLGNDSSLNFTSGNFTFVMWIYPTTESGFLTLFSRGEYSTDGYYCQTYNAGGSGVNILVNIAQSGANQTITTSTKFNLNEWQLLAITRNGNTISIYRNGVEVSYTDHPTITNPTTNTKDFYISRHNDDVAGKYNGKIDDFSIFNRVLSGTEILNYYNAIQPGSNFFNFF